jgi:hypothetical protein
MEQRKHFIIWKVIVFLPKASNFIINDNLQFVLNDNNKFQVAELKK